MLRCTVRSDNSNSLAGYGLRNVLKNTQPLPKLWAAYYVFFFGIHYVLCIAYCVFRRDLASIPHCVLRITHFGAGSHWHRLRIAYCVLRITHFGAGFGTGCVLRITYYVLRIAC